MEGGDRGPGAPSDGVGPATAHGHGHNFSVTDLRQMEIVASVDRKTERCVAIRSHPGDSRRRGGKGRKGHHVQEGLPAKRKTLRDYVDIPTPEQVKAIGAWVSVSAITYFGLWFMLGEIMKPGESGAATFLLWAFAHGGAWVCQRVGLPPLLGMLLAGLFLRNIPGGLVDGLRHSWSEVIRSGGLALILLRSGLELDWRAVKRVGWIAARLTACPGISEAVTAGLLSVPILGLPAFMGLSLGFILAAVSPAVVVSSMFEFQQRGYGVDKGIPSLVVAAASMDDVLAITGFSLFSGLAVPSGDAIWKDIVHGPMAISVGIAIGIGMGVVASITELWDSRPKRTIVMLVMGLGQMYALVGAHLTAGGAIAALVGGLVAMILWQRGWPVRFSKGPRPSYAHETEHDLAFIWKLIAQPLLFSAIGAEVDFSVISGSVIPKALAVLILGVTVRLIVAFYVLWGGPNGGLERKERLFIALAWTPKATVQAALASTPLDMVLDTFDVTDPKREEYIQYGRDVLTVAVFSILLTAPIGLILINTFGPRWLNTTLRPHPPSLAPTPQPSRRPSITQPARRASTGRPLPPAPTPAAAPDTLETRDLSKALHRVSMAATRHAHTSEARRELEAALGELVGRVVKIKEAAEALKREKPRLELDLDSMGNFFAIVDALEHLGDEELPRVSAAAGLYMPRNEGGAVPVLDDASAPADVEMAIESPARRNGFLSLPVRSDHEDREEESAPDLSLREIEAALGAGRHDAWSTGVRDVPGDAPGALSGSAQERLQGRDEDTASDAGLVAESSSAPAPSADGRLQRTSAQPRIVGGRSKRGVGGAGGT